MMSVIQSPLEREDFMDYVLHFRGFVEPSLIDGRCLVVIEHLSLAAASK